MKEASDGEETVRIAESEASDHSPETVKIEESDEDVSPTYEIQAYFRTMEYVDPNLPTEDSDSPTELPCPF